MDWQEIKLIMGVNMQVLGDNVAVEVANDLTTAAGIVLPEGGLKAPVRNGTIISVGNGEEIAKSLALVVGAKVLIFWVGRDKFPEVPGMKDTYIIPEAALLVVL